MTPADGPRRPPIVAITETTRSEPTADASLQAQFAPIDTNPGTLAAVLWNDRPLADAQRTGEMRIEGDQAAVERLVRLFPMPDPA